MTALTRLAIATEGFRGGGGGVNITTVVDRADLTLEMQLYALEMPPEEILLLESTTANLNLTLQQYVLELADNNMELELCQP